MGLEQIALYLEKFKNVGLDTVLTKRAIIRAAKEVVGVDIDKDSISVKNDTIFIEAHPAIKSELFIKKVVLQKAVERELQTVFNQAIR